eukprot:2851811-Amphidinium_carterae.1
MCARQGVGGRRKMSCLMTTHGSKHLSTNTSLYSEFGVAVGACAERNILKEWSSERNSCSRMGNSDR